MARSWRNSTEYRYWVFQVILNDKQCLSCGSKDGLHAHHLNHSKYYPEQRFVVENGVALCRGCHMTFHNDYIGNTRKKCTKKDFEEFLRIRNHFARVFISPLVLKQIDF